MRPVVLLLLPALLAGCSSSSQPALSQPKEGAFHAGTCRVIAPAVLGVGRDARRLGTDGSPPADVRKRLKQDQDVLVGVQPGLDPALAGPVGTLVVSIGLVRLRSDANSYDATLGTALSKAYDGVVAACTG